MSLKLLFKVPLVLIENAFFTFFPRMRHFIEQHLFNPLDFQEQHIEYSQNKFKEFIDYTKLSITIQDKDILELGPGGSVGFGLLALKNGANKYIALDDGQHAFINKRQLALYEKLLQNDQELFEQCFTKNNKQVLYNSEIINFVSIGQDSKYPLIDNSVDIIYSCAVLEHVHNLDLCFSEMVRVLKPGGIMYHEVDLRDHIFSQKSLWFLKIPDWWFSTLFRHTGGYVNRKRQSFYKKLAREHHLDLLTFQPTIIIEERRVDVSMYQRYSNEDLSNLSFIAVFKKP